jgi:hypothetical protein
MQSKSALRGRRINDLLKLWCLVASRGWDFCVSSTSFQKKKYRLVSTASYRKISVKNWIFDDPFLKKGLVLVIWVLGVIKP